MYHLKEIQLVKFLAIGTDVTVIVSKIIIAYFWALTSFSNLTFHGKSEKQSRSQFQTKGWNWVKVGEVKSEQEKKCWIGVKRILRIANWEMKD